MADLAAKPAQAADGVDRCPRCGSTDTNTNEDDDVYCTKCNTVIRQVTVVMSVELYSTSGGELRQAGSYIASGGFNTQRTSKYGQTSAKQMSQRQMKVNTDKMVVALKLHPQLAARVLATLALLDPNLTQGRKGVVNLCAACYVECRRDKRPITLGEIIASARNFDPIASDITLDEVGAVYRAFLEQLQLPRETFSLTDHDLQVFVNRIVTELKLDVPSATKDEIVKEATYVLKFAKFTALDEGRNPYGLLGASIWVCLIARSLAEHKDDPLADQVASLAGISVKTITNRFREIKKELYDMATKHLIGAKLNIKTFESTGNMKRMVQHLRVVLMEKMVDEERWRAEELDRRRKEDYLASPIDPPGSSEPATASTVGLGPNTDPTTEVNGPPPAKRRKLSPGPSDAPVVDLSLHASAAPSSTAAEPRKELKPAPVYLPPIMKRNLRGEEHRRRLIARAKARIHNSASTECVVYEARDLADPLYRKLAKMISEGADEALLVQGEFDAAMVEVGNLTRPSLLDDDEIDQYILSAEESKLKAEAMAIMEEKDDLAPEDASN